MKSVQAIVRRQKPQPSGNEFTGNGRMQVESPISECDPSSVPGHEAAIRKLFEQLRFFPSDRGGTQRVERHQVKPFGESQPGENPLEKQVASGDFFAVFFGQNT